MKLIDPSSDWGSTAAGCFLVGLSLVSSFLDVAVPFITRGSLRRLSSSTTSCLCPKNKPLKMPLIGFTLKFSERKFSLDDSHA